MGVKETSNHVISLLVFNSLVVYTVHTVHYFVFFHVLITAEIVAVHVPPLCGNTADKCRRIQHHLQTKAGVKKIYLESVAPVRYFIYKLKVLYSS